MGDFARGKVGKLIYYLQQKDVIKDNQKQEMRAILDMIGEPVIRLKLQEMWLEKFGTEERIVELLRQVEELKREQENG